MRQPDPLAKLHALAEWTRRDPGWAASHAFDYVQHGLSAVRAIRQYEDIRPCNDPRCDVTYFTDRYDSRSNVRNFVRMEARLAFRAALRAVGISGSL